jgi:hypothetical protein
MTVSENGVPVQGLTVTTEGAASGGKPGTVLLIDRSDSMHGASLQSAVQAARAFVAAHSSTEPIGIMYFAPSATVAAPVTTDTAVLDRALGSVPPTQPGTHIMDAASAALAQLRAAGTTEGTLVILSDGQDTGSTTTEAQLANQAAAQHVGIYTVGMQDASFVGTTLQSLAAESGGSYLPTSPAGVVSRLPARDCELLNGRNRLRHRASRFPTVDDRRAAPEHHHRGDRRRRRLGADAQARRGQCARGRVPPARRCCHGPRA